MNFSISLFVGLWRYFNELATACTAGSRSELYAILATACYLDRTRENRVPFRLFSRSGEYDIQQFNRYNHRDDFYRILRACMRDVHNREVEIDVTINRIRYCFTGAHRTIIEFHV